MDRLRTMTVVVAVAEEAGFAAAARRLNMSAPSVTRAVSALEARLETRLFEQRRSPYAPSASGRRLLETVERMEAELATASRDLGGLSAEVGGEVRITAPEFLGEAVIAESLGRLAEAHPALEPRARKGLDRAAKDDAASVRARARKLAAK